MTDPPPPMLPRMHRVKRGVAQYSAAQRVELRLAGPDAGRRALVECDGEVVGWAPLAVEVLPGALGFCL